MKFEDLQKPIEADSVEEHEKILREKMLEIQFQYVDELAQGKIEPFADDLKEKNDTGNIEAFLSKYTPIALELEHQYENRINNEFDKKECDLFKQRVLEKISLLYKKDYKNWIPKSIQLMKDEIKKLGPRNEEKKRSERRKDRMIGLIEFGIEDDLGKLTSNSEMKDLPYLSIHFQDFYKQNKDKVESLFFVENSLKELALKIVNEYPETKAVIGESWLMDTPVAKRIGFSILEKNLKKELGNQFWGQFINKDGQIDDKRISGFLKTGKPPYKVRVGIMMVEDFLKKYLPEDKKGKIILKDFNREFNEEFKKEGKVFYESIEKWDKITVGDIDKILSGSKIINDFLNTEEGKGFDLLLKDLKKENKQKEELKNNHSLEEYRKNLNEFIKERRFVNKEVII